MTNIPQTMALIVGVSEYPGRTGNLPAVENDVTEMTELLTSSGGRLNGDDVVTLFDDQATGDNIRTHLESVRAADGSTDLVYLYFSGHGLLSSGVHSFVPYDIGTNGPIDLDLIREVVEETGAQAAVLMLDICHAGGVVGRGDDSDVDEAHRELDRALRLQGGAGRVILAACGGYETAVELPALGHGVFTQYLLAGLRGAAANGRGKVTTNSLYDYICESLASFAQTPVYHANITGALTLRHVEDRSGTEPGDASNHSGAEGVEVRSSDRLALIDNRVFEGVNATFRNDGTVELSVPSDRAEGDAFFRGMRSPTQGHGVRTHRVEFVYRERAGTLSIKKLEERSGGQRDEWHMEGQLEEPETNSFRMGSFQLSNGETYKREDIVEMQLRKLLLGKEPDLTGAGHSRGVLGMSGRLGEQERSPVELFLETADLPVTERELKELRLYLVELILKHTEVDEIVSLRLGVEAGDGTAVEFRGQLRSPYQENGVELIGINGVVSR